jgi:hypothetical protein
MIADCTGFNLCNPACHWIVYLPMSKKESRRIVPLSAVAIVAFVMLVVFEVLIIGGVFGVKASTVARIAPWAYEPFLKLVGEHPESESLQESVRGRKEAGADAPSGMASVAGLNSDKLIIDLDAQTEAGAEVGSEAVLPAGNPSNTVPAGSSITNPIPERPGDVVPVG